MGIIRTVVGLAAEAATSSTRTQQTRASPPSTRQTPRYHDSYQPEIPPPNYPSAAYPQTATSPTTCYTNYPEHVQPTSTPNQHVSPYYSQPPSSLQYQPAPEYAPPAPAYYYSQAAPPAFEPGHSSDKHTHDQSISSDVDKSSNSRTNETSRLSRLFYKVRDFGPFIVVALVQPQSTTWAMVAGTGLVAAILAIDLYRWAVRHTIPTWPRIMLVAQLAAYAALLVLALSGPDTKDIANNYTMVVVNGTQAVAAFLSILLGFPFARQVAMESAPRTVWPTAGFKKLTLVLSLLWACVFAAMAGASAVIPAVGVNNMSKGVHTLCYVAPIVLLVVGLKASGAISVKAKAQAQAQATSGRV